RSQGGNEVAGAADFVSLPPGSTHPGRILATGRWGVTVSDDGGETFSESGLYRFLYYLGERIGVVEHPGGGHRIIAGGRINAQADLRVWVSDDGGATWGPDSAGVPLPEGPPDGVGGGVRGVLPRGGPGRGGGAGAEGAGGGGGGGGEGSAPGGGAGRARGAGAGDGVPDGRRGGDVGGGRKGAGDRTGGPPDIGNAGS